MGVINPEVCSTSRNVLEHAYTLGHIEVHGELVRIYKSNPKRFVYPGMFGSRLPIHGLGMRSDVDLEAPHFKIYSVSYERFDGEIPQSVAPTRDIVRMLLRRTWFEPRIGSTQVVLQ
jgi:hypothetical protein